MDSGSKQHINESIQQINSLTEDLTYMIEYSYNNGFLPYLEARIHYDKRIYIG